MAGHEHHHHDHHDHHHHGHDHGHHHHHHHTPEKLLGPDVEAQLRDIFQKEMQHPVHLIYFTGDANCMYCDLGQRLLEELTALEDRLSLEIYHIDRDAEKAQAYKVERVPATLILAQEPDGTVKDYGIRFYGLPAENEFAALLHTILAVSKREAALSEPTKKFLAQLKEPVRLDVFVTPSCPYCPNMVYLAHQMALASPLVQSNMVEAIEFPDWASAYGVSGVPHTVINKGKGEIVGMVPEGYLVEEIRRALAG